jgi:hypothetical protein
MAIKTFTTGEVLTAADTNTYLANSGLVFVKSQTVGSGVASVTVSDAFSATYDNYQIIWSGGTQSIRTAITFKLGASVTGYNGVLIYATPATPTILAATDSNAAFFTYGGGGDTSASNCNIQLLNPFIAQFTTFSASVVYGTSSGVCGTYQGRHGVATSYSGFTIAPFTGTMTGGTVTVYGYRKG